MKGKSIGKKQIVPWDSTAQTPKVRLSWGVELEATRYSEMINIAQPNSTGDLARKHNQNL